MQGGAMDILICLWLLALVMRLDGADTCGFCKHPSQPTLETGQHGWKAGSNRR